jgi:hypothetical protein
MPVLALQLDTGGSEVDFGRLRLSQGIAIPSVTACTVLARSAAQVVFADASGLPNVVSRLTTGLLRIPGAGAICSQKL